MEHLHTVVCLVNPEGLDVTGGFEYETGGVLQSLGLQRVRHN